MLFWTSKEKTNAERVVKDIRLATRRHFSAADKIRIVLEGLRGEESTAELCRNEAIARSWHYTWSKEFIESGKRRLAGDTAWTCNSLASRKRLVFCGSGRAVRRIMILGLSCLLAARGETPAVASAVEADAHKAVNLEYELKGPREFTHTWYAFADPKSGFVRGTFEPQPFE